MRWVVEGTMEGVTVTLHTITLTEDECFGDILNNQFEKFSFYKLCTRHAVAEQCGL